MMRRCLIPLLLALLTPFASGAEKLKQFVIKPGETIYARFDAKPKKLTLVAVSTEPDPAAQVIFSLAKDEAKPQLKLRIENKLAKDLQYRAEIRSATLKLRTPFQTIPVVAGKLAYETMPPQVEEFVAFDFAYARYKPAPETPR